MSNARHTSRESAEWGTQQPRSRAFSPRAMWPPLIGTRLARFTRVLAAVSLALAALLALGESPAGALGARMPVRFANSSGNQAILLASANVIVSHGSQRTSYILSARGSNIPGKPSSVALALTRPEKSGSRSSEMLIEQLFQASSAVVIATSLQSGRIATGSQLGSFGAISMTFKARGAVSISCHGALREQKGTLSGSLTWRTGEHLFGSSATQIFHLTTMNGIAMSGSGCISGTAPPGGPIPSTSPCPGYAGGASVSSFHGSSYTLEHWAFSAPSGKSVTLEAFRSYGLTGTGLAYPAFADDISFDSGLPLSDVAVIPGKLPSATIKTTGAAFESGSARFTAVVSGLPGAFGGCRVVVASGTEASGGSPLTANFDDGAMVLPSSSPGEGATLSTYTKS